VAGNVEALNAGVRFVQNDLNRIWRSGHIDMCDRAADTGRISHEDAQMQTLRQIIHHVVDNSTGPVYFLDLHTTSGETVPFGVVGDTLRNRTFALHFPVPIVFGLEEQIDGTITEYVNNLGCATMGFEGGRHDDPASVDAHEAALWTALQAAGILRDPLPPDLQALCGALAQRTSHLPRVFEVRYRHSVTPADNFVMASGFSNFTCVRRGDLLARDRQGDIRAVESARLLLPLYQKQGDDGFFLARPVRGVWLALSSMLRRMNAHKLAVHFPGVQIHPTRADTLIVNQRVARWFVIEVFHLLGYRRRKRENGLLIFSRRQHDYI
jgi:succinylglutamate desuccinylase